MNPRNVVLMAEVRHDREVEAEPVLIAVEGQQAVLTLDNGDTVALDASELRAALGEAA